MNSVRHALPVFFISVVISLVSPAAATAADATEQISVIDPYVRAVPPVVKNTAAYMQFHNQGDRERRLIAAETPIASAVELHMHTETGGMMRMRRVPHIHLPPNQIVTLEPSHEHIMLFELKKPLQPGDQIPMTLRFSDGSSQQVSAEVRRADGRD